MKILHMINEELSQWVVYTKDGIEWYDDVGIVLFLANPAWVAKCEVREIATIEYITEPLDSVIAEQFDTLWYDSGTVDELQDAFYTLWAEAEVLSDD